MSDPNALERSESRSTGRFGRVNRGWLKYGLLVGGCATVAVVALTGEDGEPQMPMVSPTATQSEITVGQKINSFLPASMTVPPVQPKPADPPMPTQILGTNAPAAAAPAAPPKPKRVVSYDTERNYGQQPVASSSAPAATTQPATNQAAASQSGSTQIAFAAKAMPGLKAGAAVDMTYVMRPGIYKMTLVNAVNSERSGSFFATLSQDVKSQAGVTLMERGTTIIGRYETAVGQGQSRIATSAAWALTPYGVPVPLGEAAVTDEAGRSGLPGVVNTHWRERWGSAFMLLLTQGAIQGATAALQSSLSQGGGNTFLNLNSSPLNQVLTDTMRGGTAIQNTVDVAAGKEIAFLLTEPVDFRAAYGLAPVETTHR